MKKIVAIGGEPGTGKTTLVRRFMSAYAWEAVEPLKLVPAMYSKDLDLYVLGKYEDGEVFAGTDRMSMAVQPAAKEFVQSTSSNILFEGDRLFNQSFLEFLSGLDCQLDILYLQASPEVLLSRYEDRGSNQSETFLKGRRTKYENLLTNFVLMQYTTVLHNETESQQSEAHSFLNNRLT